MTRFRIVYKSDGKNPDWMLWEILSPPGWFIPMRQRFMMYGSSKEALEIEIQRIVAGEKHKLPTYYDENGNKEAL